MPPLLVWLLFVTCALAILFAGTKLSVYGDVIADRTGLGRTWIGVILMASVTSLPELVTGVSSVTIYNVPDIAAGDVIGSCMFNVLILSMLDVRHPVPLSTRLHQGHVLSAGFGILLLGLAALGLAAGPRMPSVGWIGLPSVAFLGVYVVSMRTLFVHERARLADITKDKADELSSEGLTLARAVVRYTVYALLLVVSASLLPGLADRIAEITGLGHTFVGSLFVAMSTSLPEVVVSMAAVRLGAVDLAAGNLFGSNLFNVAILGVDDVFFTGGPLLASVSSTHLITAATAIGMTAVAIIGMTFRAGRKRYAFSWDAIGIMGFYAAGTIMIYLMR